MATEPFWGTWKITDVVPYSSHSEVFLLEGVEFTLRENGDVIWSYSENFDRLPLLECDTYEVLRERDSFAIEVLLRFGAWKGCIVEFKVESEHGASNCNLPWNMRLIMEGWCALNCQNVRKLAENKIDTSFHFLPALENGDFQDFFIQSRSGKEFPVHKTILRAQKINIDERFLKSVFDGFSDDVTQTLLHFIYSQSLPDNLSIFTANQVIEFARNQPNFNQLGKLCENFIKNSNFQSELVALVREMHDALNQTILMFGGKAFDDQGKEINGRNRSLGRSLVTNPAKLCSVIKQAFTNFLLVALKIVQFCDKFVKFRSNLSRQDLNAVFLFAKAQLPLFFNQIIELYKALKHATSELDAGLRYDIASYIIPEIEELMSSITMFGLGIQDVHQKVIEATCQTREYNIKNAKTKNRTLKHILITKEILYMKDFDDRLGIILSFLIQEREGLVEQPAADKIRDVARQIEQLVDEISFLIHKMQSFSNLLHEKLDLESFKFCFTVAASLIAELLEKYKLQKRSLRHFIHQLVTQLQNENIEECLISLGLYQPSQASRRRNDSKNEVVKSSLNLTSEFSTPLKSLDSELSKFCFKLFQSKDSADMEFEIVESDISLTLEEKLSKEVANSSNTTVIKAHRVIVSSRCPWFRRALTSGMKESIEKRIVLHDCHLAVFQCFLQFLYSGLYNIDLAQEQPQFLAELLVLADRYEVDELKKVCEEALIFKVDNNCCFALLVLADQFQTGKLRRTCFEYISQRPALATDANLEELPDNLKEEIQNLGAWIRDGLLSGAEVREATKEEPLRFTFKDRRDFELDEEATLREVEDLTNNMRLSAQELEAERELERIPLTTDSSRLDSCVVALREVLGPLVPEETLIQVAITADCNIDRALNHFFNMN